MSGRFAAAEEAEEEAVTVVYLPEGFRTSNSSEFYGSLNSDGSSIRYGHSRITGTGIKGEEIAEDEEEEYKEVVFEKAVHMIQTHTPYCLNCNTQLAKVILHRKNRTTRPFHSDDGNVSPRQHGHVALSMDAAISAPEAEAYGSSFPGFVFVITLSEILKSIVYGGLMELIMSTGVLFSAVASDTTTLNTLIIGFATMVCCLVIFCHDLIALKTDASLEYISEQTDRYEELLGRRSNFLLHLFVAILSFLIFGLIPPVVYAFAFYKSENKHNKIVATAAASFTCVLILATIKGCLKRRIVKTTMYYVIIAIIVCGAAYAAGDLIKVLMAKLDKFEPAATATASLLEKDIMALGSLARGSC
ncbi:membrane protein of ER body-like protein [Andrographis paniculata]|uniref:membrane protein of ER body-like protein n=1 Tax=Andrographis paniculata TaxID=175694 RepID=UPI0021E8C3EB|nr:membrane protein of ER body-like protein [Andrographis paniculata]